MASAIVNQNNLSRPIPSDVKRLVRQRDGFGCVMCGSFFYQYDHIGTEFKDAEEHNPENIVLLCGGCHDRKTRGALSTETIRQRSVNPKCKQDSFSWGPMDVGGAHPIVQLGDIVAIQCKTLLRIYGEDLFSLSEPLQPGLPFTVNAKIFDRQGNLVINIVENEIRLSDSSWDAEVVGQRITIRSGKGLFEAILRVEPPAKIVIERLEMVYKGISIFCGEGKNIELKFPGNTVTAYGGEFTGAEVVVDFDKYGMVLGLGAKKSVFKKIRINCSDSQADGPALVSNKQGRNELCACGSGAKYKRCHGAI